MKNAKRTSMYIQAYLYDLYAHITVRALQVFLEILKLIVSWYVFENKCKSAIKFLIKTSFLLVYVLNQHLYAYRSDY